VVDTPIVGNAIIVLRRCLVDWPGAGRVSSRRQSVGKLAMNAHDVDVCRRATTSQRVVYSRNMTSRESQQLQLMRYDKLRRQPFNCHIKCYVADVSDVRFLQNASFLHVSSRVSAAADVCGN